MFRRSSSASSISSSISSISSVNSVRDREQEIALVDLSNANSSILQIAPDSNSNITSCWHLKTTEKIDFSFYTILQLALQGFNGYLFLGRQSFAADNEVAHVLLTVAYAFISSSLTLYYVYQLGPYSWSAEEIGTKLQIVYDKAITFKNNLTAEEIEEFEEYKKRLIAKAQECFINVAEKIRLSNKKTHVKPWSCSEIFYAVARFAGDAIVGAIMGFNINSMVNLESSDDYHYYLAPFLLALFNGSVNTLLIYLINVRGMFVPSHWMVLHALDVLANQQKLLKKIDALHKDLVDIERLLTIILEQFNSQDSVVRERHILFKAGAISTPRLTPNLTPITPSPLASPTRVSRLRANSIDLQASVSFSAPNISSRTYSTFNETLDRAERQRVSAKKNVCGNFLYAMVSIIPMLLAFISAGFLVATKTNVTDSEDDHIFDVGIPVLCLLGVLALIWRISRYRNYVGVGILQDYNQYSGRQLTTVLEKKCLEYREWNVLAKTLVELVEIEKNPEIPFIHWVEKSIFERNKQSGIFRFFCTKDITPEQHQALVWITRYFKDKVITDEALSNYFNQFPLQKERLKSFYEELSQPNQKRATVSLLN